MNSRKYNLDIENYTLKVDKFPTHNSSPEQITEFYETVSKALSTDKNIKTVAFVLRDVNFDDIHSVAFIDSCLRLCSKNNLLTELQEADPKLTDFLYKCGIKILDNNNVEIKSSTRDHISFFEHIGDAATKFFKDAEDFLGFTGEIFYTGLYSIRHPSKIKWDETFYYIDRAGANAVPIVLLLCFLMGGILAFQGVVQMGRFGLSIFVANLVGLSIVKELGALMVAIICIGRAGSAFASEIASMKFNEEIDAMETMGLDTARYLVIPKMIALVFVMPLLTILGNIAGIIGGMLVAVLQSEITVSDYYGRTIQAISALNMMEGVFKSIIYAILISGISCFRGFEADNDAKGVGKAATSAVVSSIFLIVIADAIITTLFR